MPLAIATPTLQAMVSPSAQAALGNQTVAEFLAKSNVLKLVPIELAGANYGTTENAQVWLAGWLAGWLGLTETKQHHPPPL